MNLFDDPNDLFRSSSEIESYVQQCTPSRAWADPNADKCGCRGSGWWTDALDGTHKCPHHEGQHPEEDEDNCVELAGLKPETGPYLLMTDDDPDIPF